MRHSTSKERQDRIRKTLLLLTLLLASALVSSRPTFGQGRVYWTEPDHSSIQSAAIDGTAPTTVAQGLFMLEPMEIDADELTGWLYWTDREFGTIARIRPDGTAPEFVIFDPNLDYPPSIWGSLDNPYGISVDGTNGFLYWSESDRIRRARLDGSDRVDLVAGFRWPQALEVFPEEDLMFWTVGANSGGGTYRARLDGSDVEKISDQGDKYLALSEQTRSLFVSAGKTIIRFGLEGENQETIIEFDKNIHAVGVEEGANRLCWSFRGGIACGELDGTNPALLTATPGATQETGAARGISIDPTSRLVSFSTNRWPARLMRVRHDGSGIEDLIDPILTPTDVSVDPVQGKVYWVDNTRKIAVVSRSNLDGSDLEDIRVTASTGLRWGENSSVAVDPVSRRLYVGFSDGGLGIVGGIVSGPVAGPLDEIVLGPMFYNGIADIDVDPQEQTLYYVSGDRRHLTISRIKTDGTASETVISGIKPRGIALWSPDAGVAGSQGLERRIFWVDHESVRSANLDGSDARVILTGLSDPADLAIDQQAGILIWSEFSSGLVKRARIDGTDVRTIASSDSRISGIAAVSSPSAATLIYPPSLATGLPTSFDLKWGVPPVNARSEIQVAAGSNITDVIFALNTPATSAWFDAPIADSDYYWRARVVAAGGVGSWTPWSKFSVGSDGALAVTLTDPDDGATGVSIEPILNWESAPSASSYRVQISDTTSFDEPLVDTDSLSETSLTVGPLENETTYFWRVAGVAENGAFTFSRAFAFTTMIAAPAAVSLVSPEPEESGISAYPEFSWNPVDNAHSYTLEVALDSVFSRVVVSVDLTATTHASDVALTYDTRYFWHVRATNAGGAGPWSDIWAFRTAVGTWIASDGVPTGFELHQNYPNPFNPVTTIRYDLPAAGPVRLSVFNVLGREVAPLVDEISPAGRYEVVFDARNQPSGLYLYRLTTGTFEQTRTMTVLR